MLYVALSFVTVPRCFDECSVRDAGDFLPSKSRYRPCGLKPYGGRPSETHTFGDQLGLVPGTKSKIEDGSTVGTSVTLRTAVADFR